jgi:hypothetical protein
MLLSWENVKQTAQERVRYVLSLFLLYVLKYSVIHVCEVQLCNMNTCLRILSLIDIIIIIGNAYSGLTYMCALTVCRIVTFERLHT